MKVEIIGVGAVGGAAAMAIAVPRAGGNSVVRDLAPRLTSQFGEKLQTTIAGSVPLPAAGLPLPL